MRIFHTLYLIYAVARFGHGLRSKCVLAYQQVRIRVQKGVPVPYSVTVSLGTGTTANIHLAGTYDELVMLEEIFFGNCYATSQEPVKTILDLGANIGLAAVWFSLKYPDATIHCYEPAEGPRALLLRNLPRNAKFFPLAIAPKEGSIPMSVSERSVESSLVFHFPHMQRMSVEATTLDDAIRTIGGEVDILKIDIEGAEFDVLASSTLLSHAHAIVGEVHPVFAKRDVNELRQALSHTHTVTIPETASKSGNFYAVLLPESP